MSAWKLYNQNNLPQDKREIILSNQDGSEKRICFYIRNYVLGPNVDPYVMMLGDYGDMFEYIEPCYDGSYIKPVWWIYMPELEVH